MTNVRGSLARLHSAHHDLSWDTSEGINNDLALNRLNWVNDDSDSPCVQVLLLFLRLHIGTGEPRAKTWMRVIPADDVLFSPHLFHLIHEFLLEDWVDRLYRHRGTHLRHGEHIDDSDRIVVYDLADHQAHDFEGNTSSAMLHHLKKGE